MRRSLAFAALFLLVLTVAPSTLAREARAGSYIVVLNDAVSPGAVAAQHARRFGAEVSFVYRSALHGYAATIPAAQLDRVRADERVAFVSEDRPVHAVAQTVPTGVDRIEGDLSATAGAGPVDVDVAVIDTGVDLSHPDLNVVGGKNCSTGRSYNDGNGHGSHVAGTIGARDNAIGVVGVAPGARLWAVRVLNNAGSGSWSSVVCGIDFVDANAPANGGSIRVANMSLGGSGSDDGSCDSTKQALHKAICSAVEDGVTFVVAAGNDDANLAGFVPAAYDDVLTVTAVADFDGIPGGIAGSTCRSDDDDTAADFSNYAGSVDAGHTIAAPGVCILSTWKGGGYKTISGTSMASPHVAGTAALCIASGKCSGSPAAIIGKLRTDAELQPADYGFTGVSGRYYGSLVYAGGY